jgi:lipid II:glycine glycyltransferase (peptidoglycan interpeptide bridge formation enzyme)
MAELSPNEWDELLSGLPNPHILQTTPWGQLKSDFGWKVVRIGMQSCGAQILIKHILPGVNFAYIPKGPVSTNDSSIWPAIDVICQTNHCVFLKVEPDGWVDGGSAPTEQNFALPRLFTPSPHSIQPIRTLVVDITGEEMQILSRMKQKTRYNINLAQKKNVIVKSYTDLSAFYQMMRTTGERDLFGIHSRAYYQRAFELFHARGLCQLLVAEYESEPISALMVFTSGKRAWYFYGASSERHRDKMPNYLLQWEAMRWAKLHSCREYDLWGVPDVDLETLETNFMTRTDGLWGVYRFKRGFGGELKRSAGAWDRVYIPYLYRLYSIWLKYRKIQG